MRVIRIVTYVGDKEWIEATIEKSLPEEGIKMPKGIITINTIRNALDLADAKETILKYW